MKNTLDRLVKLNVKDENDRIKFFKQLNLDFAKHIAHDRGFEANVSAEKWLTCLGNLKTHPGICHNSLEKLDLIYSLTGGQGEIAYKIFEMRSALETIYAELLTEIVANYQKTLTEKLRKENFTFSENGDLLSLNKNNNTSNQDKLIERYKAITKLNNLFIQRAIDKDPLSEADFTQAKDALVFCLNNKPDWSERPFLQKLTDILSLGLKPLYRTFFSTEGKAEKALANILPKSPGFS